MVRRIAISHKTIFFIAGFVGLLWLLSKIVDVILLLFIAIILMSTVAPMVDWLAKRRIPRTVSILIVYILVLSLLGSLVTIIVRPLVSETNNLFSSLPSAVENVIPPFVDRFALQQELAHVRENVFTFTTVASTTYTVISTFLGLVSVAFMTFYLLLDRERIYKLIILLSPNDRDRTENMIKKLEFRLGAWLRGQLLLSLIIGFLAYCLYLLLGIPYALPLAIFAGFMEVIPVMGPIISAIPPFVLALLISPPTAILSLLGAVVIQQAENHLIVPQVMKRAVGLNPLIVILAITIGGKLLGISGALLAVPIVVVIHIFLEEYLNVDLSPSQGSASSLEK